MLYAILCYNQEDVVGAWSSDEEACVMEKLSKVQEGWAHQGRLGPVARLMPTSSATTLRKGKDQPLVIDGPFAETKEQLLGFYIVDCEGLEEAIDSAKELSAANPGTGCYEIRPVMLYNPSEPTKS